MIAGSFQFVIWPMYILAMHVAGETQVNLGGAPGTLYGIAVPASAHGIWTQPLQAVNWSEVSGASEAPKSTVRAVIAEMPAPEPTALY